MLDVCSFRESCEDYHRNNQKCTDNTAFCAMRVQLTIQKQAQRGI